MSNENKDSQLLEKNYEFTQSLTDLSESNNIFDPNRDEELDLMKCGSEKLDDHQLN
jgi:hypothetical protein